MIGVTASFLNLHHYIPVKDVRRTIVRSYLEPLDVFMGWLAYKGETVNVAKYVVYHYCRTNTFPIAWWGQVVCAWIARNGYTHLLQWAQKKLYISPNSWALQDAAYHGHVNTVEYMIELRIFNIRDMTSAARMAAKGCRLNVLNCLIRFNEYFVDLHTSHMAACCGHLNVLQWCLANNVYINLDTCRGVAIAKKYLHIVDWIDSLK